MSDEIIFAVEESAEGGYEAKALSAPIFTEADSLEELRDALWQLRSAVCVPFFQQGFSQQDADGSLLIGGEIDREAVFPSRGLVVSSCRFV